MIVELSERDVARIILAALVKEKRIPGGVDCEVRTTCPRHGATVLCGDDLPKRPPHLRLVTPEKS